MTTQKLRALVAEAVALDRQHREIESRLAEIKTSLVEEARSREEEHTPTEAGGWSWTAEGADGCIARVTQDGPSLKATITTDKDVAKAKEIAGPLFAQLFEPKVIYALGKGFRDRAEQLLGKSATRLIKALTQPGRVKISYETKESA